MRRLLGRKSRKAQVLKTVVYSNRTARSTKKSYRGVNHPNGSLLIAKYFLTLIVIIVFYFVDRASRYNSLLMTNLTHFLISLFITSLYVFRASQCSSSGDRIVLIHHLVWLVCVSDCMVCRSWPAYHAVNHTDKSYQMMY